MVKKMMALVLIFAMIFTIIPFENLVVYGAPLDIKPEISRIEYESVSDIDGNTVRRYMISGSDIDDDAMIYIYGYSFSPGEYVKENQFRVIYYKPENASYDIWKYNDLITEYKVKVQNTDTDGDPTNDSDEETFHLEKLPNITRVSKSEKVYVDEDFLIFGTGFEGVEIDAIYIGDFGYNQRVVQGPTQTLEQIRSTVDKNDDTFVITTDGDIYIPYIKEPTFPKDCNVKVVKHTKDHADPTIDNPMFSVSATYDIGLDVVKKATFLDPDLMSIIPNRGPKEGGTEIKIYDNSTAVSSLSSDMSIFIGNDLLGFTPMTDIELILGGVDDSEILGISAVTPASPTGLQGVFDIMIVDKLGVNEQVLKQAYTYEDAENLMSLMSIYPGEGKKDDIVEISGKNIFDLNVSYITNVSLLTAPDITVNSEGNLVATYSAKYTKGGADTDVTIKREIKTIIGRVAKASYSEATFDTDISLNSINKYKVIIPDTSEYGPVTVTANVSTSILDGGVQLDYIEEEAELYLGFDLLPANVIPEIESIEPISGDIGEKIYMTIRGDNFQVLYEKQGDGTYLMKLPTVKIGTKDMTVMNVYDENYNIVNGVGKEEGILIHGYVDGGAFGDSLAGPVDVKVVNPDSGEAIKGDMFDFKKHTRTSGEMPKITKIDPDIGPLTGANEILITGVNFDFETSDPKVQVTIDGQLCEIVSANSIEIRAKVPRGLELGEQPVQVITEDGAVATVETDVELINGYTYIRVLSDPEVTLIAPNYGGKGTVVYIFGKDKGPDKPTFFDDRNLLDEKTLGTITDAEYNVLINDIRPEELIGTRVFLNGIDINEIGVPDDPDGAVYEKNGGVIDDLEPDGVIFDGINRVEYIDRNLIKVTIPDGFYPGLKDVKILNPDSSYYLIEDGFDYKKPPLNADVTITNIAPKLGSNTGGDYIRIEGTDFKDGAEVYFGGYKAPTVMVESDTVMTVKTPAYPLENADVKPYEVVDVVVVNYDGSSAIQKGKETTDDWTGFKFIAPTTSPVITNIEPNEGSTLGGNKVSIFGLEFRSVDVVQPDGTIVVEKPKVYFGGREAVVEGFSHNRLEVVTPFYGREEWVDVTVKNPDAEFGVITMPDGYYYKSSKPDIISVFPDKAGKNGGENITLKGKEIMVGDFTDIIEVVGDGSTFEPNIDVLAIFEGEKATDSILTGFISLDLGDISIEYEKDRNLVVDGVTITDNVVVKYNDTVIASENFSINERHIFILDWQALGVDGLAEEGIIVEMTENEISASRRLSASAEISIEAGSDIVEVTIKTPPAATVGFKDLVIENKDRGRDSIKFEYVNALSKPVIESISPRREIKNSLDALQKYYVEGSIKGGLYITIEGYDLKKDAEVFVGGVPTEIITRLDYDIQDTLGRSKTRLVVKIPEGETYQLDKELKITVVNKDGSFVDSDDVTRLVPTDIATPVPYYFLYRIPESSPLIETVIPTTTSQYGGNRVRIIGYDFRTGLMVLIDGISCQVETVNNEEIVFITPGNLTPGTADVQVINNDFGAATKPDAIQIISYPSVTTITDEGGNTIDRVSIEGGEKIIISGKNIFEGAQVYFGGERIQISPTDGATEVRGMNKHDKFINLVDATQAGETKMLSANTLLVTLPEVYKEGEYYVTVINSDGGINDEGTTLNYRVPIPSDPVGLKAKVVNDKYIRLYDYYSNNVSYYEIYVYVGDDSPDSDEFEYIDTTTKTSYRITKLKDLDNDDEIYIKIRAVNKYGPSKWSDTVKISEDDLDDVDQIGDEDEDGDLVTNYQEQVNGKDANVVIGTKKLKKDTYMYYIDLSQDKYRDVKKAIVSVPIKIIENEKNPIMVDRGDARIQFYPNNFLVNSMYSMSESEKDGAYGRLIMDTTQNRFTENASKALPRTKMFISQVIKIGTDIDMGRTEININSIKGSMNLEMKYDKIRVQGLKESSLQIYKYDMASLSWKPLAGGTDKNRSIVYSRIYGPGYYAIIGNR